MSSPTPPLVGEELLSAVTEEMVALHERYHHRVPASAKTQMRTMRPNLSFTRSVP